MKVELAHDIIALKIWEQLPKRDKKLRRIKNSLQQPSSKQVEYTIKN